MPGATLRAFCSTVVGIWIKADPRHKDIDVLKEGTRPERIFKKWAMGFVHMDRMQGMVT